MQTCLLQEKKELLTMTEKVLLSRQVDEFVLGRNQLISKCIMPGWVESFKNVYDYKICFLKLGICQMREGSESKDRKF